MPQCSSRRRPRLQPPSSPRRRSLSSAGSSLGLVSLSFSLFPAFSGGKSQVARFAHKNDRQSRAQTGAAEARRHERRGLAEARGDSWTSSTDDLLRGLVGRIDALEAARSDLASKVEALQSDNVSLNRKVDGLTRDNAILREEIASLKYGESTAVESRKRSKTEHLALTTLGNDATVHIASFLGAKDIASLGRTCGHFGKSLLV